MRVVGMTAAVAANDGLDTFAALVAAARASDCLLAGYSLFIVCVRGRERQDDVVRANANELHRFWRNGMACARGLRGAARCGTTIRSSSHVLRAEGSAINRLGCKRNV